MSELDRNPNFEDSFWDDIYHAKDCTVPKDHYVYPQALEQALKQGPITFEVPAVNSATGIRHIFLHTYKTKDLGDDGIFLTFKYKKGPSAAVRLSTEVKAEIEYEADDEKSPKKKKKAKEPQ